LSLTLCRRWRRSESAQNHHCYHVLWMQPHGSVLWCSLMVYVQAPA